MSHIITVAKGDGISAELADAVLRILDAAQCGLTYEHIEVGEKVYLSGNSSGIPAESWDSLRRTPRSSSRPPSPRPKAAATKASTSRSARPSACSPKCSPLRVVSTLLSKTKHPVMDVVIVREDEEDTYGGIPYRQTAQVTQCLKLISRPGCEKSAATPLNTPAPPAAKR